MSLSCTYSKDFFDGSESANHKNDYQNKSYTENKSLVQNMFKQH